MVKQAVLQNNAVYSSSGVSKEEVEAAKAEKMKLAGSIKAETISNDMQFLCRVFMSINVILLGIKEQIKLTEVKLEEEKDELKKWNLYKVCI